MSLYNSGIHFGDASSAADAGATACYRPSSSHHVFGSTIRSGFHIRPTTHASLLTCQDFAPRRQPREARVTELPLFAF